MKSRENTDSDKPDAETLIPTLRDKAFQLLARREYSARELRQKFQALAPASICDRVLVELTDEDAQSDWRFAEMLCRSRFNAGKGPVKLIHELKSHEISSEVIDAAMAEYDTLWEESANEVRVRKFGEHPPSSFKEWTRQVRFLQQRGFSSEHIGHFDSRD